MLSPRAGHCHQDDVVLKTVVCRRRLWRVECEGEVYHGSVTEVKTVSELIKRREALHEGRKGFRSGEQVESCIARIEKCRRGLTASLKLKSQGLSVFPFHMTFRLKFFPRKFSPTSWGAEFRSHHHPWHNRFIISTNSTSSSSAFCFEIYSPFTHPWLLPRVFLPFLLPPRKLNRLKLREASFVRFGRIHPFSVKSFTFPGKALE